MQEQQQKQRQQAKIEKERKIEEINEYVRIIIILVHAHIYTHAYPDIF